MLVIHAGNPLSALHQSLLMLEHSHVRKTTSSRNGPVVRFNQPVTTVWTDPINRILWSPVRDCNPFLHLIESAWMLAGRNDVATVSKLAKQMGTYTDDGSTLNGAYGFRWRRHFGYDQITALIQELRTNRETRRCVLQMWDGAEDLKSGISGSSDIPCNTAIYFDPMDGVLNMTVTNRSNDSIWGAYGANLVHMSILHEYIATLAGFKVGIYYQMSNNLHFYIENEVTQRLLAYDAETGEVTSKLNLADEIEFVEGVAAICDKQYPEKTFFDSEPLFADLDNEDLDGIIAQLLDERIDAFLSGASYDKGGPFFMQVVDAMMKGFDLYKAEGPNAACVWLGECGVKSQWVAAAMLWLKRRPSYKTPQV